MLKEWLRAGLTVDLLERDRVIGHIIPESQPEPQSQPPEFLARQKRLFGKKKFPGANIVIQERGRF
jgi:hypothetical protein